MINALIVLYLWASLWCALIAARLPEAPRNEIGRAIGSVIIGIMWPVTLPMHLLDIKPKVSPSTAGMEAGKQDT